MIDQKKYMAKKHHSHHLSEHADLKKVSDYPEWYAYKTKKYTKLKQKRLTNNIIDEANHCHISPQELTEEIEQVYDDADGDSEWVDFDTWLGT